MRRFLRKGPFWLLLAALPACSTMAAVSSTASPSAEILKKPYLLRIGDEMEVTVGGRTDSTFRMAVGENGTALYPPVGEVPAVGRSLRDLEQEIEKKLAAQTAPEEPEAAEVSANEVLSPAEAFNQTYKLQPGDQLDISVWEHSELTLKIQIREDGTFPYPLLGTVQAVGRSTGEIEKEIRERLDKDYIVNPQVTVRLTGAQFTILGQKGDSGSYPIEGNLDLMTALGKAGDILTLRTSPVEILRRQGDKQVVIRANVDRLLDGKDPNIPVLPRDTIYVKPRTLGEHLVSIRMVGAKFTVLGEVNSPGAYTIERNMDLLAAISLAGGISKFGSSSVEVIRTVGEKKAVIRANVDRILKGKDSNFSILPRDTIYARRRLF